MFSQNLSTSYFVNIIKMHIQQIHLAALACTFMQLLSPYTVLLVVQKKIYTKLCLCCLLFS